MNDSKIIKGFCNRKLCEPALEIINRQQAEIEKLQAENDRLNDKPIGITHVVKDVKVYTNNFKDYCKFENYIKSEAVREFAEKLKEHSCNLTEYDEGGWNDTVSAVKVENIDRLLEGMTEGKENVQVTD